jgi:hypothetical protein
MCVSLFREEMTMLPALHNGSFTPAYGWLLKTPLMIYGWSLKTFSDL